VAAANGARHLHQRLRSSSTIAAPGPVDLSGWVVPSTRLPAGANGSSFLVQPIGREHRPRRVLSDPTRFRRRRRSAAAGGRPISSATTSTSSATNGKVAPRQHQLRCAPRAGARSTTPHIMDLVGYGSADCSEGLKTAPTLSNTTGGLPQSRRRPGHRRERRRLSFSLGERRSRAAPR